MKMISHKMLMTSVMIVALAACSDNDNDTGPITKSYHITITNLTHAQPLSPPIALLHDEAFNLWSIGEGATLALEMMAEGGDGSALLAFASANPQYQAMAALPPGGSSEFTLSTSQSSLNRLSLAGMLVNTNDAFSGLNSIELDALQPSQSVVFYSNVYDAGTEFNSELAGTIPGPADGGTGFDAIRDDVTSVVTLHGGIVSVDDGFSASTLSGADRFDNSALRIKVMAL